MYFPVKEPLNLAKITNLDTTRRTRKARSTPKFVYDAQDCVSLDLVGAHWGYAVVLARVGCALEATKVAARDCVGHAEDLHDNAARETVGFGRHRAVDGRAAADLEAVHRQSSFRHQMRTATFF